MDQRDVSMTWEPDKPHEACGVFGIYDFDGNDVASTIDYGLFALQHLSLIHISSVGGSNGYSPVKQPLHIACPPDSSSNRSTFK